MGSEVPMCHDGVMYVGNLTCGNCGLTFTSRWGSVPGADEYRCDNDHVVHVRPDDGALISVQGIDVTGATLADLRGLCPICPTELATGLLPRCPVCGGRDHEILLAGVISAP